jgi:hypothetical protein
MADARILVAIGFFIRKDEGKPIVPRTEPDGSLFAEIVIRSAKPEDVTEGAFKRSIQQLLSDFYDDARVVDPTLGVPAEREKLRQRVQEIVAEE